MVNSGPHCPLTVMVKLLKPQHLPGLCAGNTPLYLKQETEPGFTHTYKLETKREQPNVARKYIIL